MKNAINWFSIPAKDLERATAFYETILATKLQPVAMPMGNMAFFPVEEGGIGGSLNQKGDDFQPLDNNHISVYLNAGNDVAVALAKVAAAGGMVVVPKTQISPEFGCFGVIIDTEGNKVGLHSPD